MEKVYIDTHINIYSFATAPQSISRIAQNYGRGNGTHVTVFLPDGRTS